MVKILSKYSFKTFLIAACMSMFVGVQPALATVLDFQKAPDVEFQLPVSVVAADLNGDGYDDLLATNTSEMLGLVVQLQVRLCNGDGTFGAPISYDLGYSPVVPKQFAVKDLNGDEKLDVAIAEQNFNSIFVFLGNGDGTFGPKQTFAVGASPQDVVIGDFNNDGVQDMAVANFDYKTLWVMFGTTGSFGFTAPVYYHTGAFSKSLTEGDFNMDGCLDLAVSNSADENISILMNDGSGGFSAPVNYPIPLSSEITCADFNADGKPDLAVGGYDGVYVLIGNGDGTFGAAVPYSTATQYKASVAASDFNCDGKLDLASLNNAGAGAPELSIVLGNGDGTFQTETNWNITPPGVYNQFSEGTLAVGKFNNDNKPDLAIVNYATLKTVSIWLNNTSIAVTHTVGVSANPAGGGTVSGGGTYAEGTSVTVTAAANPGYTFANWTDGTTIVSTDASYTFTMGTADRNLVANFKATHTVTVSADPIGGGTVSGGGTYAEGTSVTVTAVANEGYKFAYWSDGKRKASTDASYTFTIGTADRNLVAVFLKGKEKPQKPH